MGYDNPLQNEYEGFRQRAARIEGNWCNDCHGYTHMPYCPSYEKLSNEQPASARDSDIPCQRCEGIATTTVNTRHFGLEELCEPCAVNVRRDGQEVAEQVASANMKEWYVGGIPLGASTFQRYVTDGLNAIYVISGNSDREVRELTEQIVNDHNQHQQCAAQLRFLGNRAEELSSLLAGMTTERDEMREVLEKLNSTLIGLQAHPHIYERTVIDRYLHFMVTEIDAVLNHAEQREGSDELSHQV